MNSYAQSALWTKVAQLPAIFTITNNTYSRDSFLLDLAKYGQPIRLSCQQLALSTDNQYFVHLSLIWSLHIEMPGRMTSGKWHLLSGNDGLSSTLLDWLRTSFYRWSVASAAPTSLSSNHSEGQTIKRPKKFVIFLTNT